MAASRKRPRGAARGGRRSVLVRLLPVEVEAIDRVRGGVDRNEWMRLVCARAVEAVESGPSTLMDGLAALAAPGVNPSMVEAEAFEAELAARREARAIVRESRVGILEPACPEHPLAGVERAGSVVFCAEPGCPRRL